MISRKVISYHKMLKWEYIHNNFMHLKTMIYSDLSNTVILTFIWRRSNACNTCDAVPAAGQTAALLQGLIVGSLFSLLSTRTLRSIFFSSNWWSRKVCWCMGLFLPRFKSVHFPLLNLKFPFVHFSSLSRVLLMGSTIIWFISYSGSCIICSFNSLSSRLSVVSIRF